jgi:predicted transcriptional regulator
MSHPVTVELSDEAYAALESRAHETAKSPAEIAAAALEQQFARNVKKKLTDDERRAAREQLRLHFGAVNLGRPTGSDNEGIDADLAREYGSTHEDD